MQIIQTRPAKAGIETAAARRARLAKPMRRNFCRREIERREMRMTQTKPATTSTAPCDQTQVIHPARSR